MKKTLKVKATVLNKIIMGLIVFLVFLEIYIIYDRNLFSAASKLSTKTVEELNSIVIEEALRKGKLGKILPKDMSGELWNVSGLEGVQAMFALVDEYKVRIYDCMSKELSSYDKQEYIKYIDRSKPTLSFVLPHKYELTTFASGILEAEINSTDAPALSGFLIIPGDWGLLLLSALKTTNVNCSWPDVIAVLCPSSLP
jgi:hypothetical protein